MNDFVPHCGDSNGRSVVRKVLDRRREFDTSVDWDSLIRAVSDRRRRCILYLLAEEPVVPVEDLAVDVREVEHVLLDQWAPGRDREDVHVSLVHHHLPLLEEAGIATVDEAIGTVGRGDRFSDAIDLLEGMFRRPTERKC